MQHMIIHLDSLINAFLRVFKIQKRYDVLDFFSTLDITGVRCPAHGFKGIATERPHQDHIALPDRPWFQADHFEVL